MSTTNTLFTLFGDNAAFGDRVASYLPDEAVGANPVRELSLREPTNNVPHGPLSPKHDRSTR